MSPLRQRLLCGLMFAWIFAHAGRAQDLAPRAYLITPLRSNAIILTESPYHGSIDYNGVIPVSDATGTYDMLSLSYYHSFGLFGRSANVVASFHAASQTIARRSFPSLKFRAATP